MTDIEKLDRQCRLVALMISRGDRVQAQTKINYLVSTNPTISGNIRLTITNYLLDIITNGQEASHEDEPSETDDG